jgi:CheY-like chemotaxis protein
MIYLIDDKNLRQVDFGWGEEKFTQFASIIKPLYNIEDINKIGEDLYANNNIILYHESFLDFTSDKDKALKQREKLIKIAEISPALAVVFFSGSQGARSLNDNIAYLPVSTLYQNLEILVQKHYHGSIELKYLLFGQNPEIEEELNKRLIQANTTIEEDAIELVGNTIFLHPDEDFIQNAIVDAQLEEIFCDRDYEMSEIISDILNKNEYDNIFLPLCFGQTLSDYNGLRLATHIRCTPTKNQFKRIFIYAFVGLEYLMQHEYFNILKTKNIHFVSYSKKAFSTAVNTSFEALKPEELCEELKKLKLDPPFNYSDSHSIANEWAIHQWAKAIGCDETKELRKVFDNIQHNLYFKYLRTIHPLFKLDVISAAKLKIKYEGRPKVLLIDDEAEKGWYEIFSFLLDDLNEIYTDYLCLDFNSLSTDEIIDKAVDKILTDDFDVVFLDFRLNPSDFKKTKYDEITSIKIINEIKKINQGIQVIIFSATNKVWNLQALQERQVDGFIFKDASENIYQSLDYMVMKLASSIRKSFLLKPIHKSFSIIKRNVKNLSDTFKANLDTNLSICFELLLKSFEKSKYRNYAYLQLFLIVEEFIKEDSVFEFGSNCYVITPTARYLVLSKADPTKKDSPAKSAIKFIASNGHYHIENSIFNWKVDTNFIMSAVLLFRNGLTTSGGENWSKIYSIRNKKAAHPELGLVEFSEINQLARFLEFIIDEDKLNPVDQNRALAEPSPAEQLENLKKIWGAK